MARTGWFRVPLFVLTLTLFALPALAAERPVASLRAAGFWHASIEAVVRLLPADPVVRAALSALGVLPAPDEEEPGGGDTPDLGSGLEPMG